MAIKPRSRQVITTVLPEEKDELDALADRLSVSRAMLIYRFVREGLERHRRAARTGQMGK